MPAHRNQRARPVDMVECDVDPCIAKAGSTSNTDSYASWTCHAKTNLNDDELTALCRRFRSEIRTWVKRVVELGIETYHDAGEAGLAMHALRLEWGRLLVAIRHLAPMTIDGAAEKVAATRVYLELSHASDGEAAELLAAATAELDLVTLKVSQIQPRALASSASKKHRSLKI